MSPCDVAGDAPIHRLGGSSERSSGMQDIVKDEVLMSTNGDQDQVNHGGKEMKSVSSMNGSHDGINLNKNEGKEMRHSSDNLEDLAIRDPSRQEEVGKLEEREESPSQPQETILMFENNKKEGKEEQGGEEKEEEKEEVEEEGEEEVVVVEVLAELLL